MADGDDGDEGPAELTVFQMKVARLFLALSESAGFLLAGGAALLAQYLTTRPTEDLDFFTAPERGHVLAARDALEEASHQRGWSAERIHDSDTLCRPTIQSPAQQVVGLQVPSASQPPATSW
jgi:hypothetical protein